LADQSVANLVAGAEIPGRQNSVPNFDSVETMNVMWEDASVKFFRFQRSDQTFGKPRGALG